MIEFDHPSSHTLSEQIIDMQSLVVGATGIVGGYIVQHLAEAGERPIALSRVKRRAERIDWIQGDLRDAGVLSIASYTTLYCTVDVALLADALQHLHRSSLKRLVAFTSTSIVTKMNSEIAAERAHLRRLADGERRLIEQCERLGVGWTILRPTIIYCEGRDANVSRLARLIEKFGFLPLMGDGAGLRQPVHAEDLAVGAINAAASAETINKVYDLSGGDTITYREMAGRIFDGLGKPRRILLTPPRLWRMAFAVAKPLLPKANIAMGNRMAMDMVFDASAAARDFGWRPRGFRPQFRSRSRI